jgi:hypothetical protein
MDRAFWFLFSGEFALDCRNSRAQKNVLKMTDQNFLDALKAELREYKAAKKLQLGATLRNSWVPGTRYPFFCKVWNKKYGKAPYALFLAIAIWLPAKGYTDIGWGFNAGLLLDAFITVPLYKWLLAHGPAMRLGNTAGTRLLRGVQIGLMGVPLLLGAGAELGYFSPPHLFASAASAMTKPPQPTEEAMPARRPSVSYAKTQPIRAGF